MRIEKKILEKENMAENSESSQMLPKFNCFTDVSNLGPRRTRWLTSFELFADGKGLIVGAGTADKTETTKKGTSSTFCWSGCAGYIRDTT